MQQYFLHIHSFLPLVNEGDFWELYDHVGADPPGQRLSLLLLQAMLFASCTFVAQSTIDALGFHDIRSMRAAYLWRAKLLYSLGTETSSLVIAQATLLLSFTSLSSTKMPDTVWLSLAIENAKLANAHLYATITEPRLQKHRSILKRVWWCCIIRGRPIGLLLRRPIHITNEHFDFSACSLTPMDFADESDRSGVYNAATKKRLAEIVAESAQFSTVLTHILLLVFPAKHTWVSDRKHSCEGATSFHRCMAALNRWYTRAAPTLRNYESDTAPSTLTTKPQGIDHDAVALYKDFLHMYYHTSRIVLCHHEVLRRENLQESDVANRKAKDPSTLHEIRYEIQDAVSALTECHRDLVGHGLARWLPISAIGCTALPLILSVLDIKLSSQIDNGFRIAPVTKQHQGNTLIEIMKTYWPRYDGADWSMKSFAT